MMKLDMYISDNLQSIFSFIYGCRIINDEARKRSIGGVPCFSGSRYNGEITDLNRKAMHAMRKAMHAMQKATHAISIFPFQPNTLQKVDRT